MIFNTNTPNFYSIESYKERNLYYKIFAGYLLNELVPGYAERKKQFYQLLLNASQNEGRLIDPHSVAEEIINTMKTEEIHVTFDFHTAQIFDDDKRNDRGEMSDVLIISDKHLLSIECKYGSNYGIEKDILAVQKRIKRYSEKYIRKPLQILLLKESKWSWSAKIDGRLDLNNYYCPIIVLFWEDLPPIIEDESVFNYLLTQLDRKFN